jgi:hypothetical protein
MAAGTNGSTASVRTDDWPAQAADTIVKVVGTVRDATTAKALKASKMVVYGVPVVICAIGLVILAVVMLVRFVNAYLPDAVFGETHMWAAHMIVGALFGAVGVVFLRMARRPEPAFDD